MRAIIQANFTFKMPTGGYWDPPGIPSLMVPYGLASDFYYSGHTGYFVLFLRELLMGDKHYGKEWKIIACCFLCMLYMVITVLLFKIHYSIGSLVVIKIFL